MEPTKPQRGLENNPGKDGHTFSDKHPYFPSDCSRCFANRGLNNKLKGLFLNQEKNCYSCPLIDNKMKKAADKVRKSADVPPPIFMTKLDIFLSNTLLYFPYLLLYNILQEVFIQYKTYTCRAHPNKTMAAP